MSFLVCLFIYLFFGEKKKVQKIDLMYGQMYILIKSSLNFSAAFVKDLTLNTASYI